MLPCLVQRHQQQIRKAWNPVVSHWYRQCPLGSRGLAASSMLSPQTEQSSLRSRACDLQAFDLSSFPFPLLCLSHFGQTLQAGSMTDKSRSLPHLDGMPRGRTEGTRGNATQILSQHRDNFPTSTILCCANRCSLTCRPVSQSLKDNSIFRKTQVFFGSAVGQAALKIYLFACAIKKTKQNKKTVCAEELEGYRKKKFTWDDKSIVHHTSTR